MKKQTFIITIVASLLSINSYAMELENNTTKNNNIIESNTTIENNSTIEENNLTTISEEEINTGNCIGCHGDNFEKSAMGISKIVKDLTKEYIEATLFNYKYNSNDGNMDALMSWQTTQLSDEEIRNIAKVIGK